MANPARVFARMMDWADPTGTPLDGSERIRLEWALLEGSRIKGKSIYTLPLTTKQRLSSDLIDALVDDLNVKFPTANYQSGDVVLWGA